MGNSEPDLRLATASCKETQDLRSALSRAQRPGMPGTLPACFGQAMPTACRTGSAGSKPSRTGQDRAWGRRAGCRHVDVTLGAPHRRWGQPAHAGTGLSPGVWHPLTALPT